MAHPSVHNKKPKVKTPKVKAPKLSPGQQQQAELDATLYSPSEILSGESLRNSVNSQVEAQVKPQINALNRAITTTQGTGLEQQRRARAYFDQQAAAQRNAIDMQQSLAEKARARTALYAQAGENRLSDVASQAQAQMDKDQSVRGQGLEGGARAAFAQQQAAREGNQGLASQQWKDQQNLQDSNYAGLLQGIAAASAQRGTEAATDLGNRTASQVNELIGKRTDVAASRAGLTQQLLEKMRDSEFQKIATLEGLGIKRESIAADAAAAQARVDAQMRGQDISSSTSLANNQANNLQRQLDRAQRAGDAKKARRLKKQLALLKNSQAGAGKPPKPTNRTTQTNIQKVRQLYKANGGKATKAFADSLRATGQFTEAEINAGADLATKGYVLPGTRTRFKSDLGLLPTKWRTPTKAPKYPLAGWPVN